MLPIKDPTETVPITFDFSDECGSINSPQVTVDVTQGTDASAASILFGAAVVAGATVTQLVRAGVAGVNYRLHCVAAAPGGLILARADILRVRKLPAVG